MANNCPKCNHEIDTDQNFACSKCGEKFWQSKEIFENQKKMSKSNQVEVKEQVSTEFRKKKISDYIYVFVYFVAFSLLGVIPAVIIIIVIGTQLHLECGSNYTPMCKTLWTHVLFITSVLFGITLGLVPYWRQKKYKGLISYLRRKNENYSIKQNENVEKFCSKCGSKISKKAQFCSNCGLKFTKKPITKSCWFALLLISLPIIIFILIIGIMDSKTNKVVTSNTPILNCDEQVNLNQAKSSTFVVGNFDKKDRFIAYGSGFALKDNQSKGLILTNHHVIEDSSKIKVYIGFTGISKWMDASVYADYPDQDIALLKVEYNFPNTLELADSNNLKDTETVYALGWPNEPSGLASITKGILSRRVKEDGVEILQVDAPINPGNSGGPLIYKCGVVGMNTAKMSWSDNQTPAEGTGYALSSNYIKSIIVKK